MRDHNCCPPLHQRCERVLHQSFGFSVQCGRRFIQQQDGGIAQQRAGNAIQYGNAMAGANNLFAQNYLNALGTAAKAMGGKGGGSSPRR